MGKELLRLHRSPLPAVRQELPAIIQRAGKPAQTAWRDYFDGILPNDNTRRAYSTGVRQFCSWCDDRGLSLAEIRPGDVGEYLREHTGGPSTKKLHRSANRRYFDLLVERHICLINPWAVARTEKYKVSNGKTPRIELDEVKTLLTYIDREDPAGLRDHTVIALLAGCGVRAHAVSGLRCGHYHGRPGARVLRFLEKGGSDDDIEVRHDLEEWLDEYLAYFHMKTADKDLPLFRPFLRREKIFRPWLPKRGRRPEQGVLRPNDVCRMVKRRIIAAGLREELSAHSFRVNVATDLIEQGVPVEDVQELLGHADARTTKIYDRTDRKATRNLVERIRLPA